MVYVDEWNNVKVWLVVLLCLFCEFVVDFFEHSAKHAKKPHQLLSTNMHHTLKYGMSVYICKKPKLATLSMILLSPVVTFGVHLVHQQWAALWGLLLPTACDESPWHSDDYSPPTGCSKSETVCLQTDILRLDYIFPKHCCQYFVTF